MEITPRPRSRRWQRVAARLSLLTALLAVCLLLPAALGLSHHVVADDAMGGGLSRGALVLDRAVRTADELRVGDVVTFAPAGSRAPVTRRIVSIDGSTVLTRGDARAADDPWLLDVDRVEASLTVLAVPLVGYPELVTPWLTTSTLVALVGLAALVSFVVARRAGSRARIGVGPAADAPTHAVVV
jgi:signal peptidase I